MASVLRGLHENTEHSALIGVLMLIELEVMCICSVLALG